MTGGIEKVCRILSKALEEINPHSPVHLYSMYDEPKDAEGNRYFSTSNFKGFSKRKISFIIEAVKLGCQKETVILSHVNLLLVGWLIKLCSPKTKVILLTHGIEVWQPLSSLKKMFLKKCDGVISVSRYTAYKVIDLQNVPASKVKVLNNAIDPFLDLERDKNVVDIRQQYKIPSSASVLLMLTRIASTETRKGYHQVVQALPLVKKYFPDVCFLLAGKYEDAEQQKIMDTATAVGVNENVVMTGFVPDEWLNAIFHQSDLYVMPSQKEGFGVVFVEALSCGLPVIAGNKDGSVDALRNEEFGILVDPNNVEEIANAVVKVLKDKSNFVISKEKINAVFGFDTYKTQLKNILIEFKDLKRA
jgi:glycosyltransferase involved in cell wall biosynthesis